MDLTRFGMAATDHATLLRDTTGASKSTLAGATLGLVLVAVRLVYPVVLVALLQRRSSRELFDAAEAARGRRDALTV